MLATIELGHHTYTTDLGKPIDISIAMQSGTQNPNAFGIQAPLFEPFRAGGFIGSVALGGSVNCENLFINAHGNGTHTECVGHISKERITIHETLKQFVFVAKLITVELKNNMILLDEVKKLLGEHIEALVIRTAPNSTDKLAKTYSGNNPAYLEPELCSWLCEQGVKHLLIDLPSVDPEEDGGALSAHHAFWNYPDAPRLDATITEMAFIDNEIKDGLYLLNLQVASLQTDASPSKPVLYKLEHVL